MYLPINSSVVCEKWVPPLVPPNKTITLKLSPQPYTTPVCPLRDVMAIGRVTCIQRQYVYVVIVCQLYTPTLLSSEHLSVLLGISFVLSG